MTSPKEEQETMRRWLRALKKMEPTLNEVRIAGKIYVLGEDGKLVKKK